MREHKYILVGRKPVPCPDLIKWAMWYESRKDRFIKRESINGLVVSTIFLGLDHNWGTEGRPVLFETMVFAERKSHPENYYQERCCTYSEAIKQHHSVVGRVMVGEIFFNAATKPSKTLITKKGMIKRRSKKK